MARLFISHSSKDNAQAAAIGDWLTREGVDDFFLDFDADRGIAAGERWERALHQAADRCEAVVFLVSRAWLASDWCAREFDLAAKLSKRIFGVVIDDLAVDDVPARYRRAWQFVSLASGGDHDLFRVKVPPFGEEQHVTFSRDGLKRLKAGLFAAGLDPRHFAWPPEGDPGRSPYPGLAALEAEDAGIFFGREAPLVLALDKIRDLAGRAPPRLLAILGASGAGKSSFLRAGLWPRLARDDRHFLPLPVIRPMERAISGDKGLVAALDKACTARGLRLSRAEIAEATTDIAALVALLGRLAAAALVPPLPGEGDASPPALVLAVDQAEELFPLEDRPEAARLLDLLAVLAQSNALTVIIVFTIRTESYELLQSAAASKDLKQEPFSLQPVPRGAFQTIIEGPAARLAKTRRPLIVDPALTEALMRDIEASGGRDALPLLAFTLERLYLDHGGKGSLKLADYHASGGVAGSITAAVEKALELAGRDGSVPPGRDERLALLRRGLIPWLASIDPTTGEPRRASAPRTALPAETLPLIDRLIEMRLLRTDEAVAHDRAAASVEVPTMTAAVPIEPAHEALLRQWPEMVGWLAEDKALLAALAGVRQATRDWVEHGRDPRWLAHAAGRLEDAEALLQRSDLAAGLDADHRDYLTSARAAEDGRRNAEIEQARRIAEAAEAARVAAEQAAMAEARGKRRARIGAVIAACFAIAAGAGAWFGFHQAGIAVTNERSAATERDRALVTQSRFLAEAADRLRLDGDGGSAALVALEGLPDSSETHPRPYVTEAERALYQAFTSNREISLFTGHGNTIVDMSISPDRTRFATASPDGTARIWDLATRREIGKVESHRARVVAASFDPTGERLLTAGHDGTARISDGHTGADIQALNGHDAWIRRAVWSPDGLRVATAADDGTAKIWNAVDGREIATLRGHRGNVFDVAFDRSGRRVATVSTDNLVRIWQVETGALDVVVGGHLSAPQRVLFDADGSRLLSWGQGGQLLLTDARNGDLITSMQIYVTTRSVAIAPDGKTFAICSEDGALRMFSVEDGQLIDEIPKAGLVGALAYSPSGRRLAAVREAGPIVVWDVASHGETALLGGHQGNVTVVAFVDEDTVISSGTDMSARLWSVRRSQVRELEADGGAISTVTFDPTGDRLAVASADGRVRIWDVASGRIVAATAAAKLRAGELLFSADSRRLYGADHRFVEVWSAGNGEAIGRWEVLHDEPGVGGIRALALDPQGRRLAVGGDDGFVHIIDAMTGAKISEFELPEPYVFQLAFIDDGRRVITSGWGPFVKKDGKIVERRIAGAVRIWTVETAHEDSMISQSSSIPHFLLSDDEREITIVEKDGQKNTFKTRDGTHVHSFKRETVLASKRVGRTFADLASDGRIVLHRGFEGEVVAVVDREGGTKKNYALSPRGDLIAIGANAGVVRLWPAFTEAADLIGAAKHARLRELAAGQREAAFLTEVSNDLLQGRLRWPFDTPLWREWARRRQAGLDAAFPGQRGGLGAGAAENSAETAAKIGAPDVPGIVLVEIGRLSPARNAGLERGDVVIAVDGQAVRKLDEFIEILRWRGAVQSVNMTVRRGTREMNVTVVLGNFDDGIVDAGGPERFNPLVASGERLGRDDETTETEKLLGDYVDQMDEEMRRGGRRAALRDAERALSTLLKMRSDDASATVSEVRSQYERDELILHVQIGRLSLLSGQNIRARSEAKIAKGILMDDPLIKLLEAHIALIDGRLEDAERIYTSHAKQATHLGSSFGMIALGDLSGMRKLDRIPSGIARMEEAIKSAM